MKGERAEQMNFNVRHICYETKGDIRNQRSSNYNRPKYYEPESELRNI
jgi:hypothetical protein